MCVPNSLTNTSANSNFPKSSAAHWARISGEEPNIVRTIFLRFRIFVKVFRKVLVKGV